MASSLKFLIVDDDEISRLTIEAEAARFPFLQQTAVCCNAIEASECIEELRPDIIFADIEMPGINGLELVKSLAGKVVAPVFVTSHPEFALESFGLEVFDYLLKPIIRERFERCALRLRDFFLLRENAYAFVKDQETDFITVKQGHDKYRLLVTDIYYMEAMKDYTRIVTDKVKWLVLGTLSGMQEQLPPGKFVRIHRSFVVNRSKITAVEHNRIHTYGQELPVGKSYKSILKTLI
ncbi:LytR/AlgR family response regulator transcription factor [Mucilaginibacter sp.]|uniref:LytR/AlgR family response regulator transcription factor n=1 Tax=Mucilaginibacter sp. TaxID=1882438 RepID=UPI0035BC1078